MRVFELISDKKVRKSVGWTVFGLGCLTILSSFVLLQYRLYWIWPWPVAVSLLGLGTWITKLRIRALVGFLFGLYATARLVLIVYSYPYPYTGTALMGIILLVLLVWWLFRGGLYRR